MQGAFRCAYESCGRTFSIPSDVAHHYSTEHFDSTQRSKTEQPPADEPSQWDEDQVDDPSAGQDADMNEYGEARQEATVEVLVSQNPDSTGENNRAEASKGLFNCKICGKGFPFIDEVTVHLLKTHCVILNECPYCQVTSADQSSLQIHIDFTHRKGGRTSEVVTAENQGPGIPGCVWCQKQLKHDGYCMVKKQAAGEGN